MAGLAAFLKLAATCAPAIAPETIASVVSHESGFEPLAIHVNGGVTYHPDTLEEAIEIAQSEIDAGESVDLGLGQINSENLERLGLSVSEVFEPCTNLEAASLILEEGYKRSEAAGYKDQPALLRALSAYNTGSLSRGLDNGYVPKVLKAARYVVPAIRLEATGDTAFDLGTEPTDKVEPAKTTDQPAPSQSFVVGSTSDASVLVFK